MRLKWNLAVSGLCMFTCSCVDGTDGDTGDSPEPAFRQGVALNIVTSRDSDVANYMVAINSSLTPCTTDGTPPPDIPFSTSWNSPLTGEVEGSNLPADLFGGDSIHRLARTALSLAPGCYHVAATPLDGAGNPSTACAATELVEFSVETGEVTEIGLIAQCESLDPGEADVLVEDNFPPSLWFGIGTPTVAAQCATVEVCSYGVDANQNQLEFVWTTPSSVQLEADASPTLEVDGSWRHCARLQPTESGPFEFSATVYDLLADGSRVQDHASVATSNDSATLTMHVVPDSLLCVPPGVIAWEAQLPGPAGAGDVGNAVAFDRHGDVIVAGERLVDMRSSVWLAKYRGRDGTLMWTTNYDPGFGTNVPYALVVDELDHIFLAGYTENDDEFDFLVQRYASDGSEQWTETVEFAQLDIAHAMLKTTAGTLAVVGRSFDGSTYGIALAELDPADGSESARALTSRPGTHLYAFAAVEDPVSGELIVGGDIDGPGGKTSLLARYTADFTLIDEGSYPSESIADLAVDAMGAIYSVGTSTLRDRAIMIRAMAPDFSQTWDQSETTGGSGYGAGIVVDEFGRLTSVGTHDNAGDLDFWVRRNQTSNKIDGTHPTDRSPFDSGRAIAAHASGLRAVTGGTHNGADYRAWIAVFMP